MIQQELGIDYQGSQELVCVHGVLFGQKVWKNETTMMGIWKLVPSILNLCSWS
jgi:hypothetical protein